MPISFGIKKAYTGPDEYTKLLLHFDEPVFMDTSLENHSVDMGSVTRDAADSVFGGYSAHQTGTVFLTIPDSGDWAMGNEDFTVDFWLKFDSTASVQGIFQQMLGRNDAWGMVWDGNNGWMSFSQIISGSYTININAPWSPAADTWYHVALVKSGTTYDMYIDGTSIKTETGQAGISDFAAALYIGRYITPANVSTHYQGNLDEFRISKGIARWTENFTPPTSPYGVPYSGPDLETRLLLHFDEDPFVDSSDWEHSITTVGATRSATESKFGGFSALFNGTSDYVSVADNDDCHFANHDFTIDFWANMTGNTGLQIMIGQWTVGNRSFLMGIDFDGANVSIVSGYSTNGTSVISIPTSSTSSVANNEWHHYAMVRSGTTIYHFIDGIAKGSNSVGTALFHNATGAVEIGKHTGQSSHYFKGYIEELRVSKYVARWTENFTPPTSAY